jgi:hypothetical protein
MEVVRRLIGATGAVFLTSLSYAAFLFGSAHYTL